MITDRKILPKLEHIERQYSALRFEKVAEVSAEMCETREHYRSEPGPSSKLKWRPAAPGAQWGDSGMTAWFRADVKLPKACTGRRVFVRARTGGETLFLVNGEHRGVFDHFHPVVLMALKGAAKPYHLAFETYAGHTFPGTQPYETGPSVGPGSCTYEGIDILLEREDVSAFVFDLGTLRQLHRVLDDNSLRKGRIAAALGQVYALVDAAPTEETEASWRPKLAAAREVMRPLLEARNGSTAPWIGLIAGSHIDTAWLWPLAETWRKCARTFSSALNLMDQYPEMMFLQPAPCHAEVMEREYPGIFAAMQKAVREGRWEPNGAMWVEPDCNIPSGEAFVRQLLVGQSATRRMFGYTGDTLWLPDVFGYSAALPQILKGCGVDFFCTTKMSWNDTTRFPYDTFTWRGLDGSAVITHLNVHNMWLTPESMADTWNFLQHKDLEDRRFCCYGYGDGGGGATMEMLEAARRMADLEGCPRTSQITLTEFMRGIERDMPHLPEWVGELYLELHRGTLTSIAKVKRGNRKAEFALRDAEFLSTLAALRGVPYPAEPLLALWKELLTDQFHDILPGSSIAQVNDEAVESFGRIAAGAGRLSEQALRKLTGARRGSGKAAFVVNSLSWDRDGELDLSGIPESMHPADSALQSQWITDIDDAPHLLVSGVTVPGLGATVIPLAAGDPPSNPSPFRIHGDAVSTPHALVEFDADGRICSLIDKASGREIVAPGGALNTFLLGEDIPLAWDNWDIDYDQAMKMQPDMRLKHREFVADGALQLRVRCVYRIGEASTLTQDMVFHTHTPRIDFETLIDWKEKRKLLKAAFDLQVLAENARHEIQYGHVERPTHQNLPGDRARFEVCAHKWTDLSENGFGVALLNDCKYGVSVRRGTVGLSLLKSSVHPDPRGDEGRHHMTYSLLPHACAFGVKAVVRPAYELNVPLITHMASDAAEPVASLVAVDSPHVIIESVKWAESGEGFVVRLYDAAKLGHKVRLQFGLPVKSVAETNMLEENPKRVSVRRGGVELYMRPFEIKTLVCAV